MSLYSKSKAITSVRGYTRRVEFEREILQALLGDGAGVVEVVGDPGWVWVRIEGDPDEVTEAKNNSTIPLVEGVVVDIQKIWPKGLGYYAVLGLSSVVIYEAPTIGPGGSSGSVIAAHAAQHIIADGGAGGFDPLTVNVRAMAPIRARAQTVPDMTVVVDGGYYYIITFKLWTAANSPAFVAPVPVGSRKYDLLYLGSDDALHILAGTPVIAGAPTPPTPPADSLPICFVYLTDTTTAVTEDIITDARVVPNAVTAAGAVHNLLGAVHPDTLTDSVLDGDVIIGNVTPKWSRLAVAIPAANVRNVLGIDNTGTRPSWKTALDGTNPTSVSVGGAASPGTQLIFSHRDHAHGAPSTWTAAAHNLLSAIHGDTLADTAHVGDVLIGNATPKWARLAITVPAANILNVVGVVNGETIPSWKSVHDTTVPTTIGISDAAAAGTALTASHRDHRHGSPATWTPATHDMVSVHSYTGGAALDVFGLSAPNTIARLTPSSNPGAASAILKSDASGYLTLVQLIASGTPGIYASAIYAPTNISLIISLTGTAGQQIKLNKNPGDTGLGQNTGFNIGQIGSIAAWNSFWNGILYGGHNITESSVAKYPRLAYYSTSSLADDPTDYGWVISAGNTAVTAQSISFASLATAGQTGETQGAIRFSTNLADAIFIARSGKVKIGGGTAPASALDIAGDLTLSAHNIVTDVTTGMQIGTAAAQKISFYGHATIAQQAGVAVTAAGIHAACLALGLFTA